jgi:hypothetical protein
VKGVLTAVAIAVTLSPGITDCRINLDVSIGVYAHEGGVLRGEVGKSELQRKDPFSPDS